MRRIDVNPKVCIVKTAYRGDLRLIILEAHRAALYLTHVSRRHEFRIILYFNLGSGLQSHIVKLPSRLHHVPTYARIQSHSHSLYHNRSTFEYFLWIGAE